MAVAKVILNGNTLIDTTGKTVAADKLLTGYTALDKAGESITGTYSGGGGDSWSWMGQNPILVKNYGVTKVWLKDTAYATWTPSTTNTMIVSEGLVSEGYSWSYAGDYDYEILIRFHAHFEYGAEATGTAQIIDQYQIGAQDVLGYPIDLSHITAGTNNYQTSNTSCPMKGGAFYKNTNGADAYYPVGSYGVYMNTLPSPTLTSTLITPRTPQINTRCYSAYFSTDNAAAVNQNTSYYEYKIEIWRVDRATTNNGMGYGMIRDMWLNGLS